MWYSKSSHNFAQWMESQRKDLSKYPEVALEEVMSFPKVEHNMKYLEVATFLTQQTVMHFSTVS